MKPSLHYSGLTLDRADYLRRDAKKISQLWGLEQTQILPLFELKSLVDTSTNVAVSKTRAQLTKVDLQHSEGSFLGLDADRAVFAVNCNDNEAARWQALNTNNQFLDLRTAGPGLPRSQAASLAYARGLLHWQQQNPFCALCGSANELMHGGHMMHCTAATCAKQLFPRTDPAVIMLVERVSESGERLCLLGRSPAWPEHVYSTLAGFVETGETLEEAVVREVYEESGIKVKDVRYIASQPWPFPQSIMLGFIATATTEKITIDPVELEEAHWFSESEIAGFGNWGDKSTLAKLPRPDSIARHLIDSWRTSGTL